MQSSYLPPKKPPAKKKEKAAEDVHSSEEETTYLPSRRSTRRSRVEGEYWEEQLGDDFFDKEERLAKNALSRPASDVSGRGLSF